MEMKRLNATGLRSAGYDERSRKLVVETTAGTFEYANVSPEMYRRLMNSPSPASYYREEIEEELGPGRRVPTPGATKRPPEDLFS
jgi:hypothetical protein